MNAFLAGQRRLLVAAFDVTGLSDEEIDSLTGEVACQAEASDGHPDVPIEIGIREAISQ